MKLYFCSWSTGYGSCSCVVSAINKASARQIAIEKGLAWRDSLDIEEIIISDKEELLASAYS